MRIKADVRVAVLWVREPFLYAWYRRDVDVQREDAEMCIDTAARLIGPGRRLPFIIDLRPLRSLSSGARAYFAGEVPLRSGLAAALVVGSPFSRVLGNFFITLGRPRIPTRMFTSVADAEKWGRCILKPAGQRNGTA